MKYSALSDNHKTDFFTTLPQNSMHFNGKYNHIARWTAEEQLKDPALWALFVSQFRMGNSDDADDGWRGEYWGKMMRGACLTYRYTGDEELYTILTDTCLDMLTAQDEDGRFSCYSKEHEYNGWDLWSRKYILLGFEYYLAICRNDTLADRILAALQRHADYILQTIGNEPEKKRIEETSCWWLGINSASILEPMVKLYLLTGEKRYLAFAEYIIQSGGARDFDLFETAYKNELKPYEYPTTKAYEMMSCFEGLLAYYRITGIEKYRIAVENFAKAVMETDITVIGSAGTTHELFDHSAVHQFDPAYKGIMQETCVTVTWMKFCRQLLTLTGDSIYADCIEKSYCNALTGAVNGNKNMFGNQIFTFDSYSPLLNNVRGRQIGGRKDLLRGRFCWGCCVAIANAGTALVPLTSVMKTETGAAILLYLPGSVSLFRHTVLHIETDYPADGRVTITVETDTPEPFELMLRIPAWSTDTVLSVNGSSIPCQSGTYAKLNRTWCRGDSITLLFDMRTKVIHARQTDENADPYFALQRGPVMLARDTQTGENITDSVGISPYAVYADCQPVENPYFPCDQSYVINGKLFADYASCGQTWEKDKPITVWMKE